MSVSPWLALLLWPGLWRSADQALAFVLACCVFGATAGLVLGGSPVLLSVCAMAPVLWHAVRAGRFQGGAWPPGALALAVLWAWAVLVTGFAPRLFEGETEVIGIVPRGSGIANDLVPLAAQRGNLNQLAYLTLGLATVLAMTRLLDSPQRRARLADAMLWMAGLNLLVTAVQMLHLYGGAPNLLDGLANAGYAIHLGGSIGGLQRLSGGFAEPSGYAMFTLAACAVCAALAQQRHRTRCSVALALGSLAALLLSTSSTGYVGLALLAAGHAAVLAVRAVVVPQRVRLGGLALLAWGGAVVVLAALLLWPGLLDGIARVVDSTLLGKLDSDSGRERNFWNARAWISFVETFGLGVGLGSTRASSYLLVLLSNVGIVGLGLYGVFVATTAGRALRPGPADAAPVAAAHGMLALLAAAMVSATVFDLGLLFYLLAGAAASATVAQRQPVPAVRWTGVGHAH